MCINNIPHETMRNFKPVMFDFSFSVVDKLTILVSVIEK